MRAVLKHHEYAGLSLSKCDYRRVARVDFATEKVAQNRIAGGFLVSPFIIRLAWGFHSRQRVVRFGNEMDMICE